VSDNQRATHGRVHYEGGDIGGHVHYLQQQPNGRSFGVGDIVPLPTDNFDKVVHHDYVITKLTRLDGGDGAPKWDITARPADTRA
jgi:hypothetical protein